MLSRPIATILLIFRPGNNELKNNLSVIVHLFFNNPLLLLLDEKHSAKEARYYAYGKTNDTRRLHITFTLREGGILIRVISARDMHRKERMTYDKA